MRTRKQRPANTALPSDSQVKREPFATHSGKRKRKARKLRPPRQSKTKRSSIRALCDNLHRRALGTVPEKDNEKQKKKASMNDKLKEQMEALKKMRQEQEADSDADSCSGSSIGGSLQKIVDAKKAASAGKEDQALASEKESEAEQEDVSGEDDSEGEEGSDSEDGNDGSEDAESEDGECEEVEPDEKTEEPSTPSNEQSLAVVAKATEASTAVVRNSVANKKEWDSFCRAIANKSSFPVEMFQYVIKNKKDLFNCWLDSNGSWDKAKLMMERTHKNETEALSGWAGVKGREIYKQYSEEKAKQVIASRVSLGMYYDDEDFPGDEMERYYYMRKAK